MEQQSNKTRREISPTPGMRRGASGKREGVALIIVLGFLVLLTVLIVAFYTSVTTEYTTAKTYANGASARFLSDAAVNLVMGQIAKSTQSQQLQNPRDDPKLRYTWASQPGMIRTYDDQGGFGKCYKLYSSGTMIIPGDPNAVQTELAADVPQGWNSQPANFTDLNAPVIDASGKLNFPILDGNLKPISVHGTDILTYDDNDDGIPDIEGFAIPPASVPNYRGKNPITATNRRFAESSG